MSEGIFVREFYPPGKNIFTEGSSGNHMYLVDDGEVVIWKKKEGSKVVLATIGKGRIFGEMSLIDDAPRMANAEGGARGATCVKIDATRLNDSLDKASPLLRTLIKALVVNLRKAQE